MKGLELRALQELKVGSALCVPVICTQNCEIQLLRMTTGYCMLPIATFLNIFAL